MKKLKRLLHSVKRLGKQDDQESDSYTYTLMDEKAVDTAMIQIRTLIKKQEPLTSTELEEIQDTVSQLVESGNERSIYIHSQADQDNSLLCECVLAGNHEVLKLLVSLGVNVNGSSLGEDEPDCNLPLHVACCLGKVGMVSDLLSEGANPLLPCMLTINDRTERKVKNAFEVSLEVDCIETLLTLCDLVPRENTPNDLLHKACRVNAVRCIESIITCQVYLMHERDEYGQLPLMYALRHDLRPAKKIAQKDPDYVTECLMTTFKNHSIVAFELFIQTCSAKSHSCDRLGALEFLFKYGGISFINTLDKKGQTGLHHLCNLCKISKDSSQAQAKFDNVVLNCIQCLIDHAADIEMKNKEGYTPLLYLLDLSSICNSEQIKQMNLSSVSRALKLLVTAGASVSVSVTETEEARTIVVSPLLAISYTSRRLPALSLSQLHMHILGMVDMILQRSNDQRIAYIDNVHLALYNFMVAYLGYKESCTTVSMYEQLACCFKELLQLFIAKQIKFKQEFQVKDQEIRQTCMFEEFLYVMMQDVTLYHYIRSDVVQCSKLVIDLLKAQNAKLTLKHLRPDVAEYNHTMKVCHGKDPDFVDVAEYILSGATDMQHSTSLCDFLDLLTSIEDLIPKEYAEFVRGPPVQLKEMLMSQPAVE